MRDGARVACEVQRRLAGGVRAADQDDVLVAVAGCLGGRGTVGDAAADQLLDARGVEAAVGDAGADHRGAWAQAGAAGELELLRAVRERMRPDELDAGEDLGAEAQRLLVRAARSTRRR